MTYDIYSKAMEILENRSYAWGETAHNTKDYAKKMCALSYASAYDTAWWILWYAKHEKWDELEQFDYDNPLTED